MTTENKESGSPEHLLLRNNLIEFAAMIFNRMAEKYGGGTTLNELTMLNYGFVCFAEGKPMSVMQAARDLDMPKSTASRILTGMRSKGFVTESIDPEDRRRRIFSLAESYLNRGDTDIRMMLDWCKKPGNRLC